MKTKHAVVLAASAACVMALAASIHLRNVSRESIAVVARSAGAENVAASAAGNSVLSSDGTLGANSRVKFGDWQFAGPTSIGADATSLVPGPDNDLYALSLDGTIFRSTDAAASWSAVVTVAPRVQSDLRGTTQLGLMAANAANPLTFLVLDPAARSLYRVVVGQPAQRVGLPEIGRIRVSGSTAYAAGVEGIWRSVDSGASWQKVLEPTGSSSGCSDVIAQGSRVYATCDGTFHRSTNGDAFAAVYGGGQFHQAHLAVSRSNPDIVYASRNAANGSVWLDRSSDAGNTWSQVLAPSDSTRPFASSLLDDFDEDCAGRTGPFPPKDYAFEVDPQNPEVVWIGAIHLYRSDDGGAHFGRASLSAEQPGNHGLPPALRSITFPAGYDAATNPVMYVATAAGVHATTNARAALQAPPPSGCEFAAPPAVQWSQRINGYQAQRINAVDVAGNGEAVAMIGVGDTGGVYLGTVDNPSGWSMLTRETPTTVALDPTLGVDRFYTAPCVQGLVGRWGWNAFSGRWESGLASTGVHPYTSGIAFLTPDPRNAERIWSAGYYGVMRSDDAMTTWASVDHTAHGSWLTAGAVSPADSNLAIFGDGYGSLFRRTDALSVDGSSIWPATRLTPVGSWATRTIVFDPTQPQRVYATGSRAPSVFASDDAGLTWRAADRIGAGDGLPDSDVLTLVPDPEVGDVLYAGTTTGLYVTWNHRAVDGSEPVWFKVATPFDGVPVVKLLVRRSSGGARRIHVFTTGRGIWTTTAFADRFNDVSRDQWSYDYVSRLEAAGITNGCATAPTRYCPGDPVLREQMAAFLLRAIHGGSYQPPGASGTFADVPDGHWAVRWIEQLRAEGVTNGCATDPLRYCPGDVVPREQIAVFLLRAKYGASYQPPPATGRFADVPVDSWAAGWIEQLAREGIANGCSLEPANYCPSDPVTREQMAAFLVRAFQL